MRRLGTRSRTVALVALLAVAALCAAAGRWQMQRADASRARLELLAATQAEPALRAAPPDDSAAAARYRSLEIRGRYEPDVQFLLDNMTYRGVAGYQVLTPFKVADDDRRLLVNRGWLAADPNRSVLPDVTVDARERTLRGRIDHLPRPGIVLGGPSSSLAAASPVVVSFPSAALLAERLDRATSGYQVLLDAAEPDGYLRDWQAVGIAPERHLAYAGQWFVFALVAAAAGIGAFVRLRPQR